MTDIIAIVVLVVLVMWAFSSKRDATDAPKGARSGLILYTDHETGCQYVQGGPLGGITPRLDEKGKPICGRKQ